MKAFASKNGIFAVILIAILVIFAGMAIMPANVAYAALPESYCDYIENLDAGSVKDWYFGEDYLNISEILEIVNSWKTSPDFDIEPLKDEPIIIAVIDSGIGHAYSVDGSGNETPAPKKDYYKIVDDDGNMLNYRINPMFEDVILTDADGNYVFKSVVTENKRGKQIFATLDDSVNDIAYVLADNADDNHGTHVTGTVALLIHALDLEDYVKILPIKANDSVQKGTLSNKYTAHYMLDDVKKAMDFARENGADIVSLSLTADKKSFSFDEYCDDMLLCAAAGNNGANSTLSPGYPAASEKVLGVMNYTYGINGAELSSKSNYGMAYDIAAPGSEIISSIDGKDGYDTLSGTSMATPIAAFSAALISIKYTALIKDNDITVTPEIIKTMMSLSAGETNDAKSMPTLDLLSLITTDFQKENEDDIYVDAEGLSVDGPSITEYKLNDLKKIKASAICMPNNSRVDGDIVWWYECGGQKTYLGTGSEISFTPSAVVGTYALYCKAVKDGNVLFECAPEDAFVFTINYVTLDFENIFIESVDGRPAEIDLYENEPRIFTIKDIEFTEPYKYSIVWLVDGKVVKGATGATFEFSTRDAGHHKVSARINGAYIYDVEFEVLSNPDVNEKLPAYIIVLAVLLSIAVAAVIALIVIYIVRKRKIKTK